MRRKTVGAAAAATLLSGAFIVAALNPTWASAATGGSSEVVTDRIEEIKDALSGLVSDGTLTQNQADEVAETLGDSDLGHHHGPPRGRLEPQTLADALGISVDQLRAAVEQGQTLAQVAEAEGIGRDDLVEKLVAAAEAKLDEEVSAGRLTEAEADELRGDLTGRIGESVDEPFGRGQGGHGGRSERPDGAGPTEEEGSGSAT